MTEELITFALGGETVNSHRKNSVMRVQGVPEEVPRTWERAERWHS